MYTVPYFRLSFLGVVCTLLAHGTPAPAAPYLAHAHVWQTNRFRLGTQTSFFLFCSVSLDRTQHTRHTAGTRRFGLISWRTSWHSARAPSWWPTARRRTPSCASLRSTRQAFLRPLYLYLLLIFLAETGHKTVLMFEVGLPQG